MDVALRVTDEVRSLAARTSAATLEIVEVALTRSPQLLITVDNGISSVEGVAAAKKA